jgi:hypothetical protein
MPRWKWTSAKRTRTESLELGATMNGRANDTHEDITRNSRHQPCQTVQVGVRNSLSNVCTGVLARSRAGADYMQNADATRQLHSPACISVAGLQEWMKKN